MRGTKIQLVFPAAYFYPFHVNCSPFWLRETAGIIFPKFGIPIPMFGIPIFGIPIFGMLIPSRPPFARPSANSPPPKAEAPTTAFVARGFP